PDGCGTGRPWRRTPWLRPVIAGEGGTVGGAVEVEGGRHGHRFADGALLREPPRLTQGATAGAGAGRRPGGGETLAGRAGAGGAGARGGSPGRRGAAGHGEGYAPLQAEGAAAPQGGAALRAPLLLGSVRARGRPRLTRAGEGGV